MTFFAVHHQGWCCQGAQPPRAPAHLGCMQRTDFDTKAIDAHNEHISCSQLSHRLLAIHSQLPAVQILINLHPSIPIDSVAVGCHSSLFQRRLTTRCCNRSFGHAAISRVSAASVVHGPASVRLLCINAFCFRCLKLCFAQPLQFSAPRQTPILLPHIQLERYHIYTATRTAAFSAGSSDIEGGSLHPSNSSNRSNRPPEDAAVPAVPRGSRMSNV